MVHTFKSYWTSSSDPDRRRSDDFRLSSGRRSTTWDTVTSLNMTGPGLVTSVRDLVLEVPGPDGVGRPWDNGPVYFVKVYSKTDPRSHSVGTFQNKVTVSCFESCETTTVKWVLWEVVTWKDRTIKSVHTTRRVVRDYSRTSSSHLPTEKSLEARLQSELYEHIKCSMIHYLQMLTHFLVN